MTSFVFSVFLDFSLFVLNASGLYGPGWPGPHSVAKGDFEVRVISPASVP